MGLDMYLYKLEKKEIGYLRKANMIHYWIEKRIVTNNPEYSYKKLIIIKF